MRKRIRNIINYKTMEDQNQEVQSALTASQDYLHEHVPAASKNSWMSKVNGIPNSLMQYGNTALTSVKGLSTAQKVAGGAIIAAGALYLANRNTVNSKVQQAWTSRSLTSPGSDGSSQPRAKNKSKKKSKSNPE